MLDKIASERMNHVIEKTKILMVESLIDDPSTPWEIRAFEGTINRSEQINCITLFIII